MGGGFSKNSTGSIDSMAMVFTNVALGKCFLAASVPCSDVPEQHAAARSWKIVSSHVAHGATGNIGDRGVKKREPGSSSQTDRGRR
eukprot:2869118-Amphidinium_carterae.1